MFMGKGKEILLGLCLLFFLLCYFQNPIYATEANTESTQDSAVDEGYSIVKEAYDVKFTAISEKKIKLEWQHDAYKNASFDIYQKENGKNYILVNETTDKQVYCNIKKNKDYIFKIVTRYYIGDIPVKSHGVEVKYNSSHIVSIKKQKYTYTQMHNDIEGLTNKYHEYVTYNSIGTTQKGRKIFDVVLGNKDASKSILVVSTLHAREYVATVVCMKQLEYYLENYNNKIDGVIPAEVFDKCCVHYVMMANPDGVTISQRRRARWKGNGGGVNLNGNFPYNFKIYGSRKTGYYSGKKAASEKETRAIIDLTKQLNEKGELSVVNYHAMGEIVFGDYYGKNKALKKKINRMYKTARATTGYSDAGKYSGKSYGNYREYLSYKLRIPSITIEVGSTPCPVDKKYYESIYEKNKLVVLREAQLN